MRSPSLLNEPAVFTSDDLATHQHADGRESFPSIDTSLEFHKDNILDGMSFEVIDGDFMPREFYRNVFKEFKGKVVVISVLGPQSSGKSTLLNYLFRQDFTPSVGRCTYGVYGTYFRVSNVPLYNEILALKTKGLFDILKNEAYKRDKFDRKALLCLAMLDFILINFKRDIDKSLTDVLMVCKDSLGKLQQGKIQVPGNFSILNQNTNIESHLQDIHKISELGFREDNIALPLAFKTNIKYLKNVSGLSELITITTPKKEFSDACRTLLFKIVDEIKLNLKKPRELKEVMDRMRCLWEFLSSLPSLLRHTTIKDKGAEENIKAWIFDHVDGAPKARFDRQVADLKIDKKIKADFERTPQKQYNIEEAQNIQVEFIKEFQDETSPDLLSETQNKCDEGCSHTPYPWHFLKAMSFWNNPQEIISSHEKQNYRKVNNRQSDYKAIHKKIYKSRVSKATNAKRKSIRGSKDMNSSKRLKIIFQMKRRAKKIQSELSLRDEDDNFISFGDKPPYYLKYHLPV